MEGRVTPDERSNLTPGTVDLRAILEPHIGAMEANRSPTKSVVEIFEKLGVFRMLAPRAVGGDELDFPSALDFIRRLSIIDGSMGWVAGITSGACLLLPRLPLGSLEEVYRDNCSQIVAGSAQGQGRGSRTSDGWRVSGRWPLASGCMIADWILAVFKNQDEHDQSAYAMLLPAREYVVEDTWRSMGLCGTGSHHITTKDVFAPNEFVFQLSDGSLAFDHPLYRHPQHLIALVHGAVQLGIAEAALMDVVTLLGERPEPADQGVRELLNFDLGIASAKLRAASAIFQKQVQLNWEDAIDGLPPVPSKLLATLQTGALVARETLAVVRGCFELGGSASVYKNSPLQRRLRDSQVATQHGLVRRTNFITGGRAFFDSVRSSILSGEPLDIR